MPGVHVCVTDRESEKERREGVELGNEVRHISYKWLSEEHLSVLISWSLFQKYLRYNRTSVEMSQQTLLNDPGV